MLNNVNNDMKKLVGIAIHLWVNKYKQDEMEGYTQLDLCDDLCKLIKVDRTPKWLWVIVSSVIEGELTLETMQHG